MTTPLNTTGITETAMAIMTTTEATMHSKVSWRKATQDI